MLVSEGTPESISSDTTRTGRTRSRRFRRVTVPPSERFVWGMVGLIIALIGAIILEGMYLVLTGGKVSMELLAVISGLVGSLTTCVVMGKRA